VTVQQRRMRRCEYVRAGISACSFASTFRRRSIVENHEDGFVLVFAALSLTVLLGLAGFSVDLGNWYLHIERTRAAADSAALAGAVYLPDEPEVALSEAKKSLVANHVPTQLIDQADIHPLTSGSGTLIVTVPTEVQNAFIPLIGLPNTSRFNVTSSAQWQPGLGIGDYSNALGSEPPDATRPNSDQWQSADRRANQSQFWLATGGADNDKQDGDRFGAKHCDGSSSGCTGGTNTEFKADPDGLHTAGYEYVVSANKGAQGNVIEIQVYDPAVVNTDEDCGDLQDLYAASGNNPRYAPEQNAFCAGDDGDATTYYEVFDAKTKMPVAACGPEKAFPAIDNISAASLQDPTFVAVFHEWVTICSAPYDPMTGNEYVLRVRSDINKGGENIYSLRAGLFNGSPGPAASGTLLLEQSQAAVRVFAKKDLPLWANFSGANTQFAIASIPPSYAGQDVSLELFDLGDASDPGTLSVIASGRTASGASPTASCDYIPPHSKTAQPLTNCTLPNVSQDTGYQGQAFSIVWHVPSDYACDLTGADPAANCFVFLKLAYPEGTEVHDRTTWSASGDTKPLRLVPTPKTTVPQ
jgi:hypothetical protein